MDTAGWLRDAADGRADPPPAAAHLGLQIVSAAPDAFVCTFAPRPEFANLLGGVQGGFLAAMLDVTMSGAALASLPDGQLVPTLHLSVQYLRPAPIASITGRGRVVRAGGTVLFLAGELYDGAGEVLTTATSTVRVIRPR